MNRYRLLLAVCFLSYSLYVAGQEDTTKNNAMPGSGAPMVTLSASDLESDEESQDVSGLLQASQDIFTSTAGYTFGSARFRVRGYDSENMTVMINGMPVNDRETGRAYWSTWGGLNDVTRYKEIHSGISASQHTFGGIGGSTNMETRASGFRKGSQVTYAATNRSYRNRLMFTSNTGMMKNGWAFTISGSKRWAEEGYVDGTFYDAYAYFVSAEKKINARHTLVFTGFGSPTRSGRPGVSTQETYDLAGSNYYNPYWGYQNGVKRNARVSNYHQPMLILGHSWKLNDKTDIYHAISYAFGKGGSTALEWYDAADPRPDYYRNLPSYYALDYPDQAAYYTRQWENNEEFRQLDWDHFYFANSKNLYTVQNANGESGNNISGNRSKYILESRRNDKSHLMYNVTLKHSLTDKMFVSAGVNVSRFKTFNYKVVEDLLGGDFWVDVDKYAERDFLNPEQANNDIRIPNRVVKVGDVFGYDYTANINENSAFGTLEMKGKKIDAYVGLTLSTTSFWRTGNMQNGKFPDNSLGDSEKQNFFNYGLKGGIEYKLSGRHFATANAQYMTRAPYFRDAYISSRTRDQVVNDLQSETVRGGDLSYIFRGPNLKVRMTGYYTEFVDEIWSRSFYHEDLRSFVNYIMVGVKEIRTGMEFGLETNLTPTLTASFVAAHGDYIYNSQPDVYIAQDNDPEVVLESRKVYLKGYKVGGMPETALSAGLKYNSPKYWFIGLNASYFDNIYLTPNPDRRTSEALTGLVVDDPQWGDLLDQEKLDPGMSMDLFGGKSWRFGRYYLSLTMSISNLLDEQDFAIGGFEQYRYDTRDIDRFPPKYFYLYGRSYFVNLRFSF